MRRYLIVGCGHFGSRAAHTLLARNPRPEITVVDRNRKSFDRISGLPVNRVVSDALTYLAEHFSTDLLPGHIIPAVPFHLAFEFLLASLKPLGAARAEVPPLPGLPNPMKGRTGDLYASYSDFLCPEDCPEPSRACRVTGRRRPAPLYQLLGSLKGPFESRVIRSLPLCPGVGGFQAAALRTIRDEIMASRKETCLFWLATACRCHGVVSALTF